MARFSQQFLQGLLQPSYQKGLFTTAQQIGSAPRRKREEKQAAALQKGLFGLQQGALSGEVTSEMLEEAQGSYSELIAKDPSIAAQVNDVFKEARSAVELNEKKETSAAILTLQDELREIQNSNLDPAAKAQQAGQIQSQIRELAKDFSFSEQQALGARSEQIRSSAAAERRAIEAAEQRTARFDEWVADKDLRENQRELARIKYAEFEESGDIRKAERDLKRQEVVVVPDAKNLLSMAGDDKESIEKAKQTFLSKHPGMEAVWEEETQRSIINKSRVVTARENLNNSTFDYTDEELKNLGLSEEQITQVKTLKTSTNKNKAVFNLVKSNSEKDTLPSASYAKIFVDAAKAEAAKILGVSRSKPSKKQQAQIEELAAKIGLKAAQQAQDTGNLNDGFLVISTYAGENPNETTVNSSPNFEGSTADRISALEDELNK